MAESTTKNQGEESSGSNGMMYTVVKVVFAVVAVFIGISLIYYGVQAYNRSSNKSSGVSSEDASGLGQQDADDRSKKSGVRSELVERGENGAARDSAFNLVNRKEQRA